MMATSGFWKIAAIITAATVGDGVFALPFIFNEAGWGLGLAYLLVFGAIVVLAHVVYFRTLQKTNGEKRLLGLAREHFGEWGFWTGFLSIVIGLFLVLVAYIVLGSHFIQLAVPTMPETYTILLFWAAVSIPVFLAERRVILLEILGIAMTSATILFMFFNAFPNVFFSGVTFFEPANFFLPFGAIIFSLAGWTGVEPSYESQARRKNLVGAWKGVAFGTVIAAFLKILFVVGVLGSASVISTDTVSGLADWPLWKRDVVAALGFLAVWTIFLPISREIKNALEKDLGWSKLVSRFIIVVMPLALVLSGFNNFLFIVELVGGVFLSVQYLLIVGVGRQVLSPSPAKKALLDIVAAVFIVASIYQIYTFIVR